MSQHHDITKLKSKLSQQKIKRTRFVEVEICAIGEYALQVLAKIPCII
jgi:hypothetical protein